MHREARRCRIRPRRSPRSGAAATARRRQRPPGADVGPAAGGHAALDNRGEGFGAPAQSRSAAGAPRIGRRKLGREIAPSTRGTARRHRPRVCASMDSLAAARSSRTSKPMCSTPSATPSGPRPVAVSQDVHVAACSHFRARQPGQQRRHQAVVGDEHGVGPIGALEQQLGELLAADGRYVQRRQQFLVEAAAQQALSRALEVRRVRREHGDAPAASFLHQARRGALDERREVQVERRRVRRPRAHDDARQPRRLQDRQDGASWPSS